MSAADLDVVKIKAIRTTFFVRAGLGVPDPSRVSYLKSLVDGGIQLPPIEVTPDLLLLCGRHRLMAYQELGYEEVPVRVIQFDSPAEYLAYAFKDNATASLPPTRADLRLVLKQLTGAGVTPDELMHLFVPPFSRKYIREQLDWNRLEEKHARLRAAHSARNDKDLSYPDAAKQFGVTVEDLKQFTQSRKVERELAIGSLRKRISAMNKSYGKRLQEFLKEVEAAANAGDITEAEAFSLLRDPQNYAHTIARRAHDAEQRFAAALTVESSIVKAKRAAVLPS